jgi:hypothetical protein
MDLVWRRVVGGGGGPDSMATVQFPFSHIGEEVKEDWIRGQLDGLDIEAGRAGSFGGHGGKDTEEADRRLIWLLSLDTVVGDDGESLLSIIVPMVRGSSSSTMLSGKIPVAEPSTAHPIRFPHELTIPFAMSRFLEGVAVSSNKLLMSRLTVALRR